MRRGIVGLSVLALDCQLCLDFGVGEEGRGHADDGCMKSCLDFQPNFWL